ncbi:Bug family tripartite tricarboxylate transporter substrate binding protein [Variovorax sp. YR216]|uniref:Bug family tripartite tricarboxylate transporter substrate binding protein n=1 Tax=Variovorax sp. YR216 TaxID=1882828 RepID=UPI0008959464|nr:Bug family tripartite tricarboxylate transporter substrate binding protein [Variovorax sp. YR216]SEB24858.1 Tripartite-type tricarboxylate transporter, receptor component TctC [Variovorax sp. YR216]
MNRKTFNAALLAAMLGVSMTAAAQSDQPVKILVGFPPGGSTDTVARVLAEKLSVVLKQPVIIDNKPGAGGRLAAQALKTAAPDGLTYMIAPNATPVFQALLYPPSVLRYDMLKDFAPVAVMVSYPLALAVGQDTGVKTAKDFAAWVKAHPQQASFGTAGAGGQTHFSGLQLGKAIGVNLQAVPYRGNGPLVTDLLGGQVAAGVMTAGDIVPHQGTGKVRVVAVFGAKRSPLLPDVPTFKEQGIDIDAGDAWTGMWAPAKTPPGQLDRMQNALKQVLDLPEVRDILMNKATLNPDFHPADEMDKLQRKELAYWGPVIKASGFTPDQ